MELEKLAEELGPMLDTDEAAAFLGVSPEALGTWRARNEGPKYLKLVGSVRYPAKWLKEFLLSSTVDPAVQKGVGQ